MSMKFSKRRIKKLSFMRDKSMQDGMCNSSRYNLGVCHGLQLAMAILEGKDDDISYVQPEFFYSDEPEKRSLH